MDKYDERIEDLNYRLDELRFCVNEANAESIIFIFLNLKKNIVIQIKDELSYLRKLASMDNNQTRKEFIKQRHIEIPITDAVFNLEKKSLNNSNSNNNKKQFKSEITKLSNNDNSSYSTNKDKVNLKSENKENLSLNQSRSQRSGATESSLKSKSKNTKDIRDTKIHVNRIQKADITKNVKIIS